MTLAEEKYFGICCQASAKQAVQELYAIFHTCLFLRNMKEAREHCRQASVFIVDMGFKDFCRLGDGNEVVVGDGSRDEA